MKIKRKVIIKMLEKLAEVSYDVYETHKDSTASILSEESELALIKWDVYLDVLSALRDGKIQCLEKELNEVLQLTMSKKIK